MHIFDAVSIVRPETPESDFLSEFGSFEGRKFRHARQIRRDKRSRLKMRRLILLGLLAIIVLPAGAAKRVTVEQLEQSLAADAASHRTDADVAHRLGDLELSERLTDATLDRFANKLPLGPRTALALQLLADQSAFLDPPPTELPATATPDAATEQRMMDLARGYVVKIWPHLPNFF